MKFLRYKGRFISEKQKNKRLKQIESGKSRIKIRDVDENPSSIIKGRHVVEIEVMAKALHCKNCQSILSLENIEKEIKKGLASIFQVRCKQCDIIISVPTGKEHKGPDNQNVFDINSKVALGMYKHFIINFL